MNHHDPALPTIAHVLHRLQVAGAEVLAADLSRRLRHRFNFVFLCLDAQGAMAPGLRDEGFTVLDLQRKPGIDWSVARRIRDAVAEHNIDLLHAHQYTPFSYSALSRGIARTLLGVARQPRILFTEHGRHYPDARKTKRVLANHFLLQRDDRVTAVGEFVRQALVNNEGIPADSIEVIRNGIDPTKFNANPDPALREQVRGELGLAPGHVAVLQVARFHPVKDHETALRGFAEAAKTVPEAVLLLAGDGDLRAKMESLAAELNIAARVNFLGVRSDVPRLMAAADVFLLSSLSEGVSVTLLESMGSAVPIVATAVGGNPEVVEQGVTGLLSPRRDVTALGANLTTMLRDAGLRRRMGDAGRQRLLTLYTQDQMHRGYTALYERMTQR